MSVAAETSQRVEYRTLKLGWGDPENELNELAEEGWRVVERIDVDGATYRLLLERPVNGGGHQ